MSFKEDDVTLCDEDIKDGYSRVHLLYPINDCLMIDLHIKDWNRGVEVLKIVENALKDIDLSEDIAYDKKYDEAVDNFLEHKKAKENKNRKKLVA